MPDDVTATPTATDAPAATPAPGPEASPPSPAADAPAAEKAPASTGLGFEEFLAGGEGSTEPSPDDDGDAKPADTEGDEEEAPAADKAPPAKADPPKEDPPAAAKAGDWESDENPYKKRTKDTRDSFTQVTQQLAELKRQNEVLAKKVDGTYDPAVDDSAPSADEVAAQTRAQELFQTRARASLDAAKRLYGDDAVTAAIFAEGAPFKAIEENEPDVARAIAAAPAPIIAAMELLETRAFQGRWGNTPQAIETAIRADERTKAEAEFTERLAKRDASRDAQRQAQPVGVAGAKGGGAPAAAAKPNGADQPLSSLGNPGFA
jgi:hypothetical protein